MKELKFDFTPKKIKVNGHVFDILKADADILAKTDEIMTKHDGLKDKTDMESPEGRKIITEVLQDIIAYVDEMLGKGAMKKISGGRPVGLMAGINIMKEIATSIVGMYAQDVDDKFALDADQKQDENVPKKAAK